LGVVFKQKEFRNSSLDHPTIKLSAIVGADSFFYAIEDKKNDLIHLESFHLPRQIAFFQDSLDFLSVLLVENPLLFESFSKKRFAIAGIPYFIVHQGALEQQTPVELLSTVTHLAALDTVCIQIIPALDSVCLFAIPNSLKSEIELYFDHPNYMHVQAAMIQWLSAQIESFELDRLLSLNVVGQSLLVSAWQDGKLTFHNQFKCPSIEDISYFFGATLEFLGWGGGDFKLFVTGENKEETLKHEVLLKIYRTNSWDSIELKWPNETADFLDLYAVSKCAL
jgi:hypothetical protein